MIVLYFPWMKYQCTVSGPHTSPAPGFVCSKNGVAKCWLVKTPINTQPARARAGGGGKRFPGRGMKLCSAPVRQYLLRILCSVYAMFTWVQSLLLGKSGDDDCARM